MVAVKSHLAAGFLKALDARTPAILVFGSDAGLVAERARAAAERLSSLESPPGEIIRIEDAELEEDPGRLAVELQTVPMFGGRKIIRTSASRRMTASVLKPLLTGEPLVGAIVVEAGALKADDALRALFEKSAHAAAIACYADEGRDLEALVSEVLDTAGVRIDADARTALLARLGADRALSRGELEKLVLYVGDRKTIEPADVDAIVGDASALAIERILSAATGGRAAPALAEFDRACASGESPQMVIAALQRHLHRLHRVRSAVDAGRTMDDAVRHLRPPVYFKEKDALTAQVRAWTTARLTDALSRSREAARAARLTPLLDVALAERLLLDVAVLARAGDQRPRPS